MILMEKRFLSQVDLPWLYTQPNTMRAIATCLRYSSKIPSTALRATRTARQQNLLCSTTASWSLRSSFASDAFAVRNLHASSITRAKIPKQSNRLITEKSPYLLVGIFLYLFDVYDKSILTFTATWYV